MGHALQQFTGFMWQMQIQSQVAANPQTKSIKSVSVDWYIATVHTHYHHLLLLLWPESQHSFCYQIRVEKKERVFI